MEHKYMMNIYNKGYTSPGKQTFSKGQLAKMESSDGDQQC